MKQQEEKTEETEAINGGNSEEIKKEIKAFVEVTEQFFSEIKGKYGGYEETFKKAGIDLIKL